MARREWVDLGNVDVMGLLTEQAVETGITAYSGGGQTNAKVGDPTKFGHSVDTVAAGNDSVRVPIPAVPGARQFFCNTAAANSMQLFGLGTDTINKVATATGIAVAAGKNAYLYCITAGDWRAIVA